MLSISRISFAIIATIILISATSIQSCDSAAQKEESDMNVNQSSKMNENKSAENISMTENDLTHTQIDYKTEIAYYKRMSYDLIAANENAIVEFKKRVKRGKVGATNSYATKITEIEQTNNALKKRLDEHKEEGSESWDFFKLKFSHDMDLLSEEIKEYAAVN